MFYNRVVFCLFIFTSTLIIRIDGSSCRWKDDALPSVEHGIRINMENLKLYSDDTAEGYFDVRCRQGYRINEDLGSRVTCLEYGQWSTPLPQCLSMGSCLISELFDFIQQTNGIQMDQSKSFIFTDGIDDSRALGGSNLTVDCRTGYENHGGSSLIQCTEQNTWTTFPQCVSTSTGSKSLRCSIFDDTWFIPNGYLSKADDILIYSDNTASGSAVVSCHAGYILDSNNGDTYSCNEGIWSPKPNCIKTERCSLSLLENFVHDPSLTHGLDIVSQEVSKDSKEDNAALIGSFILFQCRDGFTNTDGTLNVTCNANGQWSPFPSCISNTSL